MTTRRTRRSLSQRTGLMLGVLTVLISASQAASAAIYQDFEPGNGSGEYGWPINGASVIAIGGSEPHFNTRSWKVSGVGLSGTGVQSQIQRWDFNMEPEANDRLTFWLYALPLNRTDNNVSVRFFDHGAYHAGGFEVWTTQTARYGEWTQLAVLFSQLPPDIDLHHIDKLEFVNYWPGTYYYDNIASSRDDRVYQAFEPSLRSGSTAAEYGWKWNDADTADFSGPGEPVHEGEHSWKLVSTLRWGGTGIQSQEQKFDGAEQTFWHVDVDPAHNDRLTFWLYALPENKLDNNLAVQFYDHGAHATDETKVAIWTKQAARYGQWTRLTILFSELPSTLDLRDLNKIQFQHYWPGTYYLDDIRATGPFPAIDLAALPLGALRASPPVGSYEITESTAGPDGPWSTYGSYAGQDVPVTRLTHAWYRLGHSDPAEYLLPEIVIDSDQLKAGALVWNTLPQTDQYEVAVATSKQGPWSRRYLGFVPVPPLHALAGEWYRVRAVHRDTGGAVAESGAWGPPLSCTPGRGFVRADRTELREDDGTGNAVVLRGVNLGSFLLLEKWMTGIGDADTPPIEDEWTMRQVLTSRFGASATQQLFETYQRAYLQDADFDALVRLGVTLVRLPVYFRVLQDDDGRWVTNASGAVNFDPIDRVVKACADRGIYVLLDLHGAPGAQNNEIHSGRQGFNQLFASTPDGERYRTQTVDLWRAIAQRYREQTAVLGYDLLNEPVGAPAPESLWALYDRLYRAIRSVDTRHVVVMEGIWDWTTLPRPSVFGWKNVLYQFHWYLFGASEDAAAHQAFIDAQVAQMIGKQQEYQVPAMIGEFTGFSLKPIWQAYVDAFTRHGLSWTVWSHKFHNAPSDWGLYTHADYDEAPPTLRALQTDGTPGDSFTTLSAKFAKYDTAAHHAPNRALHELLGEAFGQPSAPPFEFGLTHNPPREDLVLQPGQGGSTKVDLWHWLGSEVVSFSVSGLPSGATATVTPSACRPNCSPTVSVTTGASTPSGTFTATVTGTGGGVSHATTFTLYINVPPPPFDFSITHNPPASQDITVEAGKAGTTQVEVWHVSGSALVSFSVSGLPAGAAASVSPNACTPNCAPIVTVTTKRSTPTGTFSVTVTGTGGGATHRTTFQLTVTPAPVLIETPWQTNAYGTLHTNVSYESARGYHFTPLVSGRIVALGGFFNGAKSVKLFNKATGQLLASANVTAANTWAYTPIAPVTVSAGTPYTVAVYVAGPGGSRRSNLDPRLPRTFGDIRIEASTYIYTGSNGTARPTNSVTTTMYGQADIQFSPD